MALTFTVIDTTSSPLWDFGWFDRSRFGASGTAEARDCEFLLREFLRSPTSQRSFCTSPDPWGASVDRHGPYPSEKLVADWYKPVDITELRSRVANIIADPRFKEPPSLEQQQPIERWLDEVCARGDAIYALEAPADSAVDWDLVWLLFHEFVTVSPDGSELTVAVVGYD